MLFHFQNIYKSDFPSNIDQITNLVTPRVNAEMNCSLLKNVEEWEVKAAVFELGPTKSPGPDGLNGLFYQKHWETIKHDVVEAVRGFFNTTKLPDGINSTHITLVPKIATPEEVSQFRPINCCNFIYKIFSKVLANRMKTILKSLISENQSAFVQGRQIQDNILVAHEMFNCLKRRNGRGAKVAIIKLDMSKAYDRQEWCFIKEMMLAMGFDVKWVMP